MSKLFAGRWTSAGARGTSRNWRGVGGISLTILLLFAPVALANSAGRRLPALGPEALGAKACQVLNGSKLPGIPQSAPGLEHTIRLTEIGDGCFAGRCFDQRTDPNTGSTICHYSRVALVAMACHPNRRAATAGVEQLIRRHHFRRIRLNLDAAAVGMPPKETGIPSAGGNPSNTREVAMALGVETAAFVVHADSEDDPSPIWPGIERAALQGARNLIGHWKILPHVCPGR